jgi:hypothetical protein
MALAAELAHDARMAPQVATGLLVPADALVDRLVADVQRTALLSVPAICSALHLRRISRATCGQPDAPVRARYFGERERRQTG